MAKDTQEELKRLEAELLAQETQKLALCDDLDEFLEGLLDEHTDSLAQTGPIEYRNFANGYGEPEPEEEPEPAADNLNIQLCIATGLILAIVAVLIYWVVRFL
jgi:hypothetical protein